MDDALRPAADAGYRAQLDREPLDDHERLVASQMIGRPLRGTSAAAVRCGWGLPAVLRVSPQLDDGTPFPTTFWLACPIASSQVGTLEGSGVMHAWTDELRADPQLGAAYSAAHERYVTFRDLLGAPVPRSPSAGGMPRRVKCLHSLYAHLLATGDNPIGDRVAARIEPMACPGPCVPAARSDAGETA